MPNQPTSAEPRRLLSQELFNDQLDRLTQEKTRQGQEKSPRERLIRESYASALDAVGEMRAAIRRWGKSGGYLTNPDIPVEDYVTSVSRLIALSQAATLPTGKPTGLDTAKEATMPGHDSELADVCERYGLPHSAIVLEHHMLANAALKHAAMKTAVDVLYRDLAEAKQRIDSDATKLGALRLENDGLIDVLAEARNNLVLSSLRTDQERDGRVAAEIEVAQLRALITDALTMEPCHITGMHSPDHHVDSICAFMKEDGFDRLAAAMGYTEPRLEGESFNDYNRRMQALLHAKLPRRDHAKCNWCTTYGKGWTLNG